MKAEECNQWLACFHVIKAVLMKDEFVCVVEPGSIRPIRLRSRNKRRAW